VFHDATVTDEQYRATVNRIRPGPLRGYSVGLLQCPSYSTALLQSEPGCTVAPRSYSVAPAQSYGNICPSANWAHLVPRAVTITPLRIRRPH
jgi:hypothetical protein